MATAKPAVQLHYVADCRKKHVPGTPIAPAAPGKPPIPRPQGKAPRPGTDLARKEQ